MAKFSFQRIVATGRFIPEIDGLRFIAITSVLLYHLSGFLTIKIGEAYTSAVGFSWLDWFFIRGHVGVPLFFVISGFVLGIPFASHYIKGENAINLKKYFLRRLTRLEPPYILVMLGLFILCVFALKKFSFTEGLETLIASIFYVHNFVYDKGVLPKLNGVAWSLEIEVQFYIIAPLLAYIFHMKFMKIRRPIIIASILSAIIINHAIELPFISLINFIQYFLVGFLLTDLYVSNAKILPPTKYDGLVGIFCLIGIWFFDWKYLNSDVYRCIYELVQVGLIFLFYYYVLMHKIFKILTWRILTNIGGMCYSIYLIHYLIISAVGNYVIQFAFSKYYFINVSLYFIIILIPVLVISSCFFLLIERPCMDKNWYKKLFNFNTVTYK